VSCGKMPVPMFNATLVETGQRFVASPVLGPSGAGIPRSAAARQLYELYPEATPLVSTMVRLSATFPFVSPICRPNWRPGASWLEKDAYHFADGGYIDNEGMVTCIEWLTDHLDHTPPAQRTFDRILFLRLMPFPASDAASADLDRGWFYETLGPIDAMTNVRTASQQERNDLAVRLFTEAARARWSVDVASTKLQVSKPEPPAPRPAPNAAQPAGPAIGVKVMAVRVAEGQGVEGAMRRTTTPATAGGSEKKENGAMEPPLSWSLTDSQKAAIQAAWQRIAQSDDNKAPLKAIRDWFTPGAPSAPQRAEVAVGEEASRSAGMST
jgi:hypothetical protein